MMTLFNKEMRHCIIDKCNGCKNITIMKWKLGSDVRVCNVYLSPRAWWNRGTCPLHPTSTLKASNICGSEIKVRAGQQKQKKKGD